MAADLGVDDGAVAERLAHNVKQLREARGFTQQQCSKVAGVPRATWANLESGAANPTLAVLHRVALSLQVSIEELIASPHAACRLYPKGTLPVRTPGLALVKKLLPDPIPGMEIDRIELPAGARMTGVPHTPGTREYLTCESGELLLVASGEKFTLRSGDVAVFRGDQRHSYASVGARTAIGYSVVVLARVEWTAPAFELSLLFADAHVAAFDKPSGLLVHRGWGDADVTAVELARRAIGDALPVHRLDRATSGVLVFARDKPSARALHEAFESGEAEKSYVALVRGEPPARGAIDHPIPRREGGPRVAARSTFETLWSGDVDWALDEVAARDPRLPEHARYSLVVVRPATGRLHQVRRHMKHIHHPVIGDANYGKGEHNRAIAARFGLARLALHACGLRVTLAGERYDFEAPLPADLREPLARMGAPSAILGALRANMRGL